MGGRAVASVGPLWSAWYLLAGGARPDGMPTALLWLLVAWFGAVVSGYYMRRWRESSARECDEVLVFYRRELEQSIARCGG